MSTSPCPYFALRVGKVSVPGYYQILRVPICRCALTESLVTRLRLHPDGEQLASLLEGPPLGGHPHSVMSADLQPIAAIACADERKQSSCLPHFLAILNDFGLDSAIPAETSPYLPAKN